MKPRDNIIAGIGALFLVCVPIGGFATWLLGRAEAQGNEAKQLAEDARKQIALVDGGMRAELRLAREDFERRLTSVEGKVERVDGKVDEILKELRRQRR